MSNCAIVGINWGDEGKGRMVDLIAREYDIVCRYQGGNNAGHLSLIHISEPTRQAEISYAVFCLKKKKKRKKYRIPSYAW